MSNMHMCVHAFRNKHTQTWTHTHTLIHCPCSFHHIGLSTQNVLCRIQKSLQISTEFLCPQPTQYLFHWNMLTFTHFTFQAFVFTLVLCMPIIIHFMAFWPSFIFLSPSVCSPFIWEDFFNIAPWPDPVHPSLWPKYSSGYINCSSIQNEKI